MALDNLKLALALRLADKISAPAKKISGVNKLLAGRLRKTQEAILGVNKQAAQTANLSTLQSHIGKAATQADAAKKRLAGLWREFNNAKAAGRSTKHLQQQISTTQSRVAKLAARHGELKDKANAARAALRKEGIDTRNLGAAQAKLDSKLKGLNQRMERHKRLLHLSSQAGEKLGNAWGRIKSAGKWVAGGVTAIGLATMPMISTAAQFENYQTILTTIEGSESKARQSMEWVSNFAAKTPYDLAQVNEAFVRLKAYGLDPTNGLLRTLGDTSSAMGKDVMSAVEAIADAVTGENERLKEFGIKASMDGDLVTYSYTDKAGNQKAMSAIKSDRKQIENVLRNIWDEKFSGGMERGSKTWTGVISNIMDTWSRFQMMVMNSGPFQRLKGYLVDLLAQLDTMAQNGQLQEWAEKAGGAIMQFIDGAVVAGQQIWGLIETVAPAVTSLAEFTGGWGNLAAIIGGGQLLGGFEGVGKLLLWIGRLSMSHPILALITGLAAGAIWVVNNWESIKSTVASVIDWIISKLPDWLKDILGISNTTQAGEVIQQAQKTSSTKSVTAATALTANMATAPVIASAPVSAAMPMSGGIQATINIHTQPGDDKQAIAMLVRQEIERLERERASRNRNKLYD